MPDSTVTSYSHPTTDSVTNLSNSRDIRPTSSVSPTQQMQRLLKEKKIARDFQSRKHVDWNDTYDLARNINKTNRLTQRQAVNIPLLKETVKTLLSKIDDPPMVEWRELAGNLEKQIIFQATWDEANKSQNLEGVDLLDKKNVLMYGRSFKFLNWEEDHVSIDVPDIYDVVIDPLTRPLNIESARFIVRQNIFRSLREILADERYDKLAKNKLRIWLSSKDGIVQSDSNRKELEKKHQRLKDLGILEDKFQNFSAGDVIVNLSEHYTNEWNQSKKDWERRVVVYADDAIPLLDEPLKDLLGVEFWPFVSWGEDIETNDFWSDGIADLVRIPNKIVNVWFSQLVENRTLRNFQMHWYDSTIQGYVPQTYEPGPGRMLPSPGNPKDKIMPVEISGLDDTLQAIGFVTNIIERATSTGGLDKGQVPRKRLLKNEVQALLTTANERVLTLSKFYRRSWYELATKWYRITNANSSKKTVLYKTDKNGKLWPRPVYPSDWKSDKGYEPNVRSSSEQEQEKTKSIQRFQFLLQQFPTNVALRRIAQRRMLDILDLTPEELREVEQSEENTTGTPIQGVSPSLVRDTIEASPEVLTSSIQQRLAELKSLNA